MVAPTGMAGNASQRLRDPYTTDDQRARFPQEETVCETIESTMPRGPRSRPAHPAQTRAFEGINDRALRSHAERELVRSSCRELILSREELTGATSLSQSSAARILQ